MDVNLNPNTGLLEGGSVLRLIYSRSRNPGSLLLRTALWSSWSHCGVLTEDGTVIEAAVWHGVIERPLSEHLHGKSQSAIKNVVVPDAAAGVQWARLQIGKPYDWLGVIGLGLRREWERADDWFCSELCERAVLESGRRRFDRQERRITPQDQWMVV